MASQPSIRAQLKSILELYKQAEQKNDMEEARNDVQQATMRALRLAGNEGAPPISFNLAGDLMFQQHMRLIGASLHLDDMPDAKAKNDAKALKDLANNTLEKSIMYYKKASKQAERCILTAVKYGRALVVSAQLKEAKRVLQRAKGIDCPIDPMVHNIEITRDAFSTEELIAYTKKEIESQLLYIEVARNGQVSGILKQLRNGKVEADSLLKAAAKLADAQPRSARVKLLYPHIVTNLLGSGRLNDCRRGESLSNAFKILKDLSIAVPRSLVVSLAHVKLLVALGFFDSEKECIRALQVSNPDDPWEHDIPLGSTSGDIYDARIMIKRQEIACIIDAFVNMVKLEFSKLCLYH